jgi:hypothetical protein
VQNALRMVRVLGLVTVQERRQHGPLVLEALAAIGRKGEHPVSAIVGAEPSGRIANEVAIAVGATTPIRARAAR